MTDHANITVQPGFVRNKRLIIAILFATIIAGVFWSQSRVPALNEKAQMGLRTSFSSIAFDIVLPIADDQSAVERVARSTVNWLYTNWKGMAFGLLFAAAALTILGFVRHRGFRRPWMNTISGVFIGAPLGVCVNCATPIAQGMYAAGARLETALATLISSPTLNVIVLSMAFTLLPWEIAIGNVLAVILLLASLPLLVRRFSPETTAPPSEGALTTVAKIMSPPQASPLNDAQLGVSLRDASRDYIRNLLYIGKIAVPLMLLAGALGAVVIELAPFDRLADISPTVPVLIGTAFVATFLPVPIAFNVVVVMALLANGMDPGLGAVLMFALGVYSIYPATIIAKFVSARLSIAMAVVVIVIATLLGFFTSSYFDARQATERQDIKAGLLAGKQNTYASAVGICDTLPDALQMRCFATQIPHFQQIVAYEQMCDTRPAAVDRESCQQMVDLLSAREAALSSASSDVCMQLGPNAGRAECVQSFVLKSAIDNHDVLQCDSLTPESAIQRCRALYLNSSLLFNPDDSVCKNLAGQDLADCRMNARIYRIADTLDMQACEGLPLNAQSHCRWVTASALVGRSNDASGCRELQDPALRLRCEEQVVAWEATRSASLEQCNQLQSPGLDVTCKLRVAERQISAILTDYSLDLASTTFSDETSGNGVSTTTGAVSENAPTLDWNPAFENDSLIVTFTNYQEAGGSSGNNSQFRRVPAAALGISKSWEFRLTDFFEPFIIGKGISSGDFNNDLWPDLVLATERGAAFYRNVGGHFEYVAVEQAGLQNENLFLVALVDADGDGREDLFASAYGGQNFLLINRDGDFADSELISLDGDQRLTMSAGFGDIDQDGDLDIVLGNWSSGAEKLFSAEDSGNVLMRRQGEAYTSEPLNDVKGETNSILLTDINNDQRPDMLFGNDRLVPDLYYLNDPEQLSSIRKEQNIVPATSMFTMSLESADFNNDLAPDIFSTDMTFARSSNERYCDAILSDVEKNRCESVLRAFETFNSGSAADCSQLESQQDSRDCFIAFSIKAAKAAKDSGYCDNLPDKSAASYSLCLHIAGQVPAEERINQDNYLPQTQRNVLLMNMGDSFAERSEEFGIDSSFWSWNAKAADLDNDGWQDIYVGNGFHFGDSFYEVQPNVMYRNREGSGFDEVAADWGLDDKINTPSYTYVDFDLDGDLDIIASGVLSAPRVFINEESENNSLTVILRQDDENSRAIGAIITIHYGERGELHQRKEIKMSGGFLSFDNAVAHFGIGTHEEISRITVVWPDGQQTTIDAAFSANRFYKIQKAR